MGERNDGGPAFPVDPDVAGHEALEGSAMGMSLRDYFAAKAMQALIRNQGTDGLHICELAYDYADVMLVEREKGND